MVVAIASELLQQILDHCERSPDREVCGLLFGTATRIEHAAAAANVAADPARAFEIDPAQLIAAHRAERAGGPRLIGHYHSHPNGRAEPSPCDRAAARGGEYWLVVARGAARLFAADADGFRAVRLEPDGVSCHPAPRASEGPPSTRIR